MLQNERELLASVLKEMKSSGMKEEMGERMEW